MTCMIKYKINIFQTQYRNRMLIFKCTTLSTIYLFNKIFEEKFEWTHIFTNTIGIIAFLINILHFRHTITIRERQETILIEDVTSISEFFPFLII